MAYTEYKGNIFASSADTIVNTVNCVGVMGKGVALEFRRRFPFMFEEYASICSRDQLEPGTNWFYAGSNPRVLNMAVKADWRFPSRMQWVEGCLRQFQGEYEALGIESIAFPWIGAMNGGLAWDAVHDLMRRYLRPLPIKVEVVEFDPSATDPLFERLLRYVKQSDATDFAFTAGLRQRAADLVWQSVNDHSIGSMSELTAIPGLGATSVECVYRFLVDGPQGLPKPIQQSLFST